MNTTFLRRSVALVAAVALALGMAACGDDDEGTSDQALVVTDAWARTSPMNVANGAAYMTIVSPVDDALLSASVDASVAAAVEVHETVDSGGMMEMRPVDRIALPAGTPVLLIPGGYHVMLLDLAAPLEVGTTIMLTLTFEKAGVTRISVPVRDAAP